MLGNIDSDKFALDNYVTTLPLYATSKSWFINNQRFLLSTTNNKITGQYYTSLWFKVN